MTTYTPGGMIAEAVRHEQIAQHLREAARALGQAPQTQPTPLQPAQPHRRGSRADRAFARDLNAWALVLTRRPSVREIAARYGIGKDRATVIRALAEADASNPANALTGTNTVEA